MGDRYHIPNMKCKHCNKVQSEHVYYAPSSEITSYRCEECRKENEITLSFE